MRRILLVEDDPGIGSGLKKSLEFEGYEVVWARDLRTAKRENEEHEFQLVLLDLGLPDGSGISFCTQIRETGSRLPIIILTAQTHEESVVAGLQAGANDYVRKPFGNRELLARIENVLREPKTREDQLRFVDLLVLRTQRKVMFNSSEIELTRREYDILVYLTENAEGVVTRERLMNHVDQDGQISDRTLDSHLSHVRSKLKKAGMESIKISPVYGIGYRLEKAKI
jgi:two-component system, OmpR family, response regulator